MKILTFDIEEWFHLLSNGSTKTVVQWANYECRIHANMEHILSILEKQDQKATFFCVGWIAEKYPELIKSIAQKGFEIGSHSQMHQLVYEQSPKEFTNDLDSSIKTIEDLTGKKVKYFRAPGFSIRKDNKWAFEILAQHGIEVDCSISPLQRTHVSYPSFSIPVPSILKYNGIELKELPINYNSWFGKPIMYSGGGYFRLFPYSIMKKWIKKSDYVMSYLHPRDFDAEQPMIDGLSLKRKFKSYVGLKGATQKLDKLLFDFEFVDIKTANKQIDWEKVPIVNL